MKKSIGDLFGYKNDATAMSVTPETDVKNETTEPSEEWVWVEGYKGTSADMSCRGYHYEFGKRFDMPEDAKIEDCESGFHLCLKLKDVFDYYSIGEGNRFFKVRALVRNSDVEEYGHYANHNKPWYMPVYRRDKLAAKSIEFISELTADEILKDRVDIVGWSDEEKRLALATSIDAVHAKRSVEELMSYGYSETFARYLVANDRLAIARAVGSQPGLSMDMKVFAIMKG